jgi:hypothetical protein
MSSWDAPSQFKDRDALQFGTPAKSELLHPVGFHELPRPKERMVLWIFYAQIRVTAKGRLQIVRGKPLDKVL